MSLRKAEGHWWHPDMNPKLRADAQQAKWNRIPQGMNGEEAGRRTQKEGWHCKWLKQLRTSKTHLIFSRRVHQPSADFCVGAWQYLRACLFAWVHLAFQCGYDIWVGVFTICSRTWGSCWESDSIGPLFVQRTQQCPPPILHCHSAFSQSFP